MNIIGEMRAIESAIRKHIDGKGSGAFDWPSIGKRINEIDKALTRSDCFEPISDPSAVMANSVAPFDPHQVIIEAFAGMRGFLSTRAVFDVFAKDSAGHHHTELRRWYKDLLEWLDEAEDRTISHFDYLVSDWENG